MGSPESGSRKGEGPDNPSRRWVLQGMLSAGATAAMPGIAKALTNEESLRDSEDEKYFNTLIRDPIARKHYQENPKRKEAAAVLRSIAKTKASWIEEFNRDPGRMHKGALAFYDSGTLKGNGTILKIPVEGKNEFRYLVVTAAHVADQVLAPVGTSWTRHSQGRDVAVRELSEDERARVEVDSNALLLPPLQNGKDDITGEVGAVIAHGNSKNSPVRKLYPSRLSPKVSYKVLTATRTGLPEHKKYMLEEDYAAVRMVTLPYDEAAKMGPKKDQPPPINRTSGSAFVYMPSGSSEMAFGGIFVSGGKGYAEGVTYDLGYVLDHMYVRETIAEHQKASPMSSDSGR